MVRWQWHEGADTTPTRVESSQRETNLATFWEALRVLSLPSSERVTRNSHQWHLRRACWSQTCRSLDRVGGVCGARHNMDPRDRLASPDDGVRTRALDKAVANW